MWPTVSMSLYVGTDSTKELVFSRPTQKHWWLDGFNPNAPYTDPNNLTLDAVIDFGNSDVAQKFADKENLKSGAYGRTYGMNLFENPWNIHTTVTGTSVTISWIG